MDVAEGGACSPVEQHEDTSSASVANKPVRRRRLAHRRQYAKSRRMASSFLRSQFVRYDALSYYHDSDDSWHHRDDTLVQRDQLQQEHVTDDGLMGATPLDKSFPSDNLDGAATNSTGDKKIKAEQHQRALRTNLPNCSGQQEKPPSSPIGLTDISQKLISPPIIFSRQRNSKPEIPVSVARTFTGEHHSISMPSPRSYRVEKNIGARAVIDYSSSSLDSCSLVDSSIWDAASSRLLSSPSLAPSAAQSLNHLPNYCSATNQQLNEPGTQVSIFQRATGDNRSHLSTNRSDQQASRDKHEPSSAGERVAQSETVDLERIRLISRQQKADSPHSTFFPGSESFRVQIPSDLQTGNNKPQPSPRVVDSKSKKSQSQNNFPPLHRSIDLISPLRDRRRGMSEDCIDNVHFNDLFHGNVTDSSSVTVNQSVRTDPRLYKDDVDIKFSRALNSCKLPQIRYASKERLFERLTDLRFLSIDFLNTFLLTYRVFTAAEDVLEALKSVHYNSDRYFQQQQQSQQPNHHQRESFSTFADSSLVSLNNNSTINTTNNAGSNTNEDNIVYETNTQTSIGSKSPNQLYDIGQLSAATCTQANSVVGDKSNTSREPVARSIAPLTIKNNQQSRPFVPPRSPGADTNIHARLNSHIEDAFLLAPDAYQHAKRRSTISALTPITGSNSSSLANLAHHANTTDQNQTGVKESAKVMSSCSNSTKTHSYQSDADDLGLEFSDFETSSPVLAGMERARSSSTSSRPVTAITGANSSLNLAVPGARQTRAASLSITPSVNLMDPKGVSTPVSVNNSIASEHWRLSYKKTQTEQSEGSKVHNRDNRVVNETDVTPGTTNRRASSADISVKLQVTPAQHSTQFLRLSDDEALSCRSDQPTVPPSTPIEKSMEYLEADIAIGGTLTVAKRRPNEVDQSGESPSQTVETTPKAKKRNKKKYCKASTTSSSSLVASLSSSSLSTSSASTSPVMSSQSESGLIQSTSSFDDVSTANTKPRSDSKIAKQGDLVQRKKKRRSIKDKDTQLAQQVTRRNIRVIKEIDLTQTKTVDCDTSADDDKISTSSGDCTDNHMNDSDDSEVKNNIRTATEDDRSVKILTKLNSVRIDDDDDDVPKARASHKMKKSSVITSTTIAVSEVKEGQKVKNSDSILNCVRQASPITSEPLDPSSPSKNRPSPTPTPSRTSPNISKTPDVAKSPSNAAAGLQSVQVSSRLTTPRSSFQHHGDSALAGDRISKAGVIVTASSPRVSSRRSSTASAASAFAAATAASNNPILTQPPFAMRNQSVAAIQSKSSNELAGKQTFEHASQLDPVPCTCNALRRGSYTGPALVPQQQMLRQQPKFVGVLDQQANRQIAHHPSCLYFQQVPSLAGSGQIQPHLYGNTHSDASSLCNSRASSRLSSCAGLEYSSHSSAQVNFYAQQQRAQGGGGSQGQSLRSSNAGQIGRIYPANPRSKRNSTQINIRSVATIRVLSVLRHWVSKHSQDFVNDTKLSYLVQEFLQDLIMDANLLPAEHKAALQLQQMVQKAAHSRGSQVDLDILLAPPSKPSSDSIETLSALEIAEGMTYLDHKIFLAIRSEEFLGQAWMKVDKAIKAPHILLITKRFNDVSRLVSSEIIRVLELPRRVAIIEKWTNVAHICRVVHNFNGVLQICAAFTNSAVFRLKKTWDKIPKTTKQTIDQLQNLVSTDSRFRNMRDAINRCDPPSIPYVGMYLTDLSFIEEGTPNYSPDGLLNFSKMRMIAHVIREIQHLQNGSYKIDLNSRVANYLLDSSRHLQDDEMYRCSLAIEPRSSGGKNGVQILNSMSSNPQFNGASNQPPPTPSKTGSSPGGGNNS